MINMFYISDKLYPVGAFFCDTPPYVIAINPLRTTDGNRLKIATHPAPKHLILKKFHSDEVDIIEVESTYRAAELCFEEVCEACLTTKTAAEEFNLTTIETSMSSIPMLWTIFASK